MPTQLATPENASRYQKVEQARILYVTGKVNSVLEASKVQGVGYTACYNASKRDDWRKQRADFHHEKLLRESIPMLAAALSPPGESGNMVPPIPMGNPEPMSHEHFVQLNKRYVLQIDELLNDVDAINSTLGAGRGKSDPVMTHDERCNLLRTKVALLERSRIMLGIPEVSPIRREQSKKPRAQHIMPMEMSAS